MPVTNEWFPAKNEKNVVGQFGYEDILDIPTSKARDEKVYKKILVIYIRVTGDLDKQAPLKVLPSNQKAFINRFPEAWAAFEGHQPAISGTPLDALGLGADKLLELRIFGVTKLEQAANLSDQQCENMGFGAKTIRSEARKLLDGTPKPVEAQPAPKPADFDKAVADAVARAMAAQKPAKHKGGRPRKAKPDQTAEVAAVEPVAA